jgi:hypothetical protein
MPGPLGRFLDGGTPAQHNQISQRDLLAAGLRAVEVLLGFSRSLQDLREFGRLLTSQSFCGARRMRAPLAPPRLSLPRNVDAEAHAVETNCDVDSPEARILPLSRSDIPRSDQFVIHCGHRVLPQLRLGNFRAQAPRDGPKSRCVSLYHALAKATSNSLGFSWKRFEIFA